MSLAIAIPRSCAVAAAIEMHGIARARERERERERDRVPGNNLVYPSTESATSFMAARREIGALGANIPLFSLSRKRFAASGDGGSNDSGLGAICVSRNCDSIL